MASARLDKIDDPRPAIKKLKRQELKYLARKEGRDDINENMPAMLMQRRFTERPPQQMPRPMSAVLGSQQPLRIPPYNVWLKVAFSDAPVESEPETVEERDALDDLERQWIEQESAGTDFEALPFWTLKQECKKRGINFKRTDNKAALLEKLNGQDTS